MLKSQTIVERILNYLNIYATSDVIERGEKLFNKGCIEDAHINESGGSASFQVMGSKLYSVSISGLNDYIASNCSCPFDWGPVCKHQVAAMQHLIKEYGGEGKSKQRKTIVDFRRKKPATKLRSSSAPFTIKDFQLITNDIVSKYKPDYTNLGSWQTFETDLFWHNKIHFLVLDTISYHNPDYFVKFWHTRDGLKTNCDCGQMVEFLCNHQLAILTKIANSPQPDIFNLILPNKFEKIEKDILSAYGLAGQEFNKFLDLMYEDFQISWVLKPEFNHLLPVVELNNHELQFENNFKDLDDDRIKIEKPINLSNKTEARHPGFAFRTYKSLDILINDKVEIICFSAKENRSQDKLLSNFKNVNQLNHSGNLILNSNQKTLLEKISFYENIAKKDNFKDDHDGFTEQQLSIFDFLKKAFPLLGNEKYVFKFREDADNFRIRKMDLLPVKVSLDHPELEIEISESELFLEFTPKLCINDTIFSFDKLDPEYSHFLYSCINNTLFLHKSISQSFLISKFSKGKLAMVKSEADIFFEKYIKPVSKHCKINFNTDIFTYKEVIPKAEKRQLYLSEYADFIVFKPIVQYEDELKVQAGGLGDIINKDKQNNIVRHIRDVDFETEFIDFIVGLHPEFKNQQNNTLFHLEPELLMKDFWFFDAYAKIEQAGIEVFGMKDLKSFKYSPHKARINTGIKSEQDWFEVEIDVAFGNNNVDLKSIRKAILKQEKYIRLSDGSIGILPSEWFKKLEVYFRAGEVKDDKLQISKLKFSIIDELFEEIDDAEIMKELAEKRRKLKNIDKIQSVKKPKEITAVLRNYQKEGLNWLNILNEMGWGGILADDMGLGKTLQVLTFIQKQVKKSKKANLIIVPTTLLFNWEMELKKFAPQLRYHFHYGINRDKEIKNFNGFNIVFTSYGILVQDIELLRKFKFNYIILDESQAIKNPSSKRYKAAFLLQAKNKLTLTGTPIENSTFDLFAQMNFVNPGFLGTINTFKEQYSKAIDREGNVEVSKELNKIISPFILRRTKEQVAKDLPPKTENILYCEMDQEQREVYDAYRNKYRDSLLKRISDDGLGKSKIFVLEGLMKLRQICDSPTLLSDDENYGKQSIKITELLRHISEKTSNHKILIFSQFVKMLQLIKNELVKNNIIFEYLDGKSSQQHRKKSVNHFQEDKNCRVFLISLKAGGTGLNLTAADYVYIVDPWWNPAVENQAIDRTHRIGQGKNVFAYRMICKDTVEEKILKLQERKKKIAKDIISTDESLVKKLTENDIRELFS